jgi:hypothetical protein
MDPSFRRKRIDMSTWKLSKPGVREDAAGAKPPPSTGGELALKSAQISSFELDADSYDGGDPYNRTGQFLVEHLRRLEQEK